MEDEEVMKVADKKTVAKYVRRGGVGCLFCGSDDLEGESIDVDAGGAQQRLSCKRCGGEWADLYSLSGVMVFGEVVSGGGKR